MTPELVAAQQAAGLPLTSFNERLTGVDRQDRALYRVLLTALAGGVAPPGLAAFSAAVGLTEDEGHAALRRLAAVDLVALDSDGGLVGVFPLSAAPTRHVVRLEDGRELQAMCAVDALGIPSMLGLPAVVVSTDPSTDRPITVTVSGHELVAEPTSAVVLLAREGHGSLASACCRVIDSYEDRQTAMAALVSGRLGGTVLELSDAHALGVALFAGLRAP